MRRNSRILPVLLAVVSAISGGESQRQQQQQHQQQPPRLQLWSDAGGGSGSNAVETLDLLTDYASTDADGRVLWTGRRESSSCRGTVTHLRRDQATVIKSHYGYGLEPYPADYNCRWLFIPDECDLGVECSMGTRRNLRRSRNSFGRQEVGSVILFLQFTCTYIITSIYIIIQYIYVRRYHFFILDV